MNASEALYTRRSCRAFKPTPVARYTLPAVLNDALHTPPWTNTQPWEVFVAGGKKFHHRRNNNTIYIGDRSFARNKATLAMPSVFP